MRLIRLKEVSSLTGLSRTAIYSLSRAGKFPRHLKITERASAWVEADVTAWVQARIEGREWTAVPLSVAAVA